MLRCLWLVPLLALAPSAQAQDLFAGHRGGDLVVYGNYCGPGQRGRHPKPIDALDRACMRHDACTPIGAPAPCGCHARLRREAARIALSPIETDEVRAMAGLVSQAAGLMACR
jgi:tRNA(fMet)-specific endonuclease VapC